MKKIIGAFILAALSCAPAHAKFDFASAVPVAGYRGIIDISSRIARILDEGEPVTLAILPENIAPSRVTARETWAIITLLWDLEKNQKFTIVERRRLDLLLAESKLTYSGMLAQGVEPGKLAGVNYILIISEVNWTETTQIAYKLVELRTARIIAASVD